MADTTTFVSDPIANISGPITAIAPVTAIMIFLVPSDKPAKKFVTLPMVSPSFAITSLKFIASAIDLPSVPNASESLSLKVDNIPPIV